MCRVYYSKKGDYVRLCYRKGKELRGKHIPLEVADALGWGTRCVRWGSARRASADQEERRWRRRKRSSLRGYDYTRCTRCGRVTFTDKSWCDACIHEWEEERRKAQGIHVQLTFADVMEDR